MEESCSEEMKFVSQRNSSSYESQPGDPEDLEVGSYTQCEWYGESG